MTIRPSSRSNGTGPARGDSRAGVTEVSGRRPGAGSSASEQTGEGAAPTRRRRAVRYDRQRPGHQQGADSATPAPQGAGSFYWRGGTRRRPGGRRGHLFGSRGTGRGPAGRGGRLRQTAAPPQHTTPRTGAPRVRRASRIPRVPRNPGHLGYLGCLGCLGTPRRAGRPGYLGTRGFRAVEAVSRGPARNAIIAQNDQKRPSKNRTTTTSAQMR